MLFIIAVEYSIRKTERHDSTAHDCKLLRRKPFQIILKGIKVLERKHILNFLRLRLCHFSLCGRSKGKHNRPRWNFTGNVNSQPVAGRYFYGLRHGHREEYSMKRSK